ncbi:MAG: SURF1 family cytochrome oxidase biogenesis protein [Hyphomicrobiaceae bacterium]
MLFRLAHNKLLVPTVLSALAFCLLFGLGTWQWNRKTWKETILATLASRGKSPPIPATASWPGLPCHDLKDTGLANGCEYQPVSLRGVFEHTRERHIFTAAPQVQGLGSRQGYWIFTPLRLDGSGKTVYVNRGFVPDDRKEASKRVLGQTSQSVEVFGLYRSAQVRATFDGQNDTAKNIYYVRNPSELWPVEPDAPVNEMWAYVDQTGPVPAGGFPLPLAGKVTLSNRHLEYAITWFGLAATLFVMYVAYARSRLKPA